VNAAPPPPRAPAAEEPHTAPHDELLGIARELIRDSSSNAVTLDTLANALKARGFSRTPGSPRLITRLRRIRELAVSRSGHITLVEPLSASGLPAEVEADSEPGDVEPRAPTREAPRPADDPRSLAERRAEVEAAQSGRSAAPSADGAASPETPDAGPGADGHRRRRSRRGGRRRRRHGAPAPS
jgi:hypothetical protein